MPPDLVYIVRDGENPELRFSLRSVAANLPHGRVWIVGGGPEWLVNVGRIPSRQTNDKHATTLGSLIAACKTRSPVSSPFVLVDDDFFVVATIDVVPTLHRGPLADLSGQRTAATNTARILAAHGIVDPLCYDLHTPFLVDKRAMLDAIATARPMTDVLPKTLYGNLRSIGGSFASDVKVHGVDEPMRPGLPFVSTNDRSFRYGRVGEQIRALFPGPSRYEG